MVQDTKHSRRSVIAAAAGAVTATAITAVAKPLPALGAGSDGSVIHVGDVLSDVRSTTYLTNRGQTVADVFWCETQGSGTALAAFSVSGSGVYAQTTSGNGVEAGSQSGYGVRASSDSNVGVVASSNQHDAIEGFTYASGKSGCYGEAHDKGAYGIFGRNTTSNATGYLGGGSVGVGGASPTLTGVYGSSGPGAPATPPTNTGVYGFAGGGRGGQFSGKAAQIRLQPSTAVTHPASGQRGDLFVDASGRLWFCKGNSNWVQLA